MEIGPLPFARRLLPASYPPRLLRRLTRETVEPLSIRLRPLPHGEHRPPVYPRSARHGRGHLDRPPENRFVYDPP